MPQNPVRVGIHGAMGRMGRRLIQLIAEDVTLSLSVALEHTGHPELGDDAGRAAGADRDLGVPVEDRAPDDAAVDVMIDFSSPDGAMAIGAWCRQHRVPLIVGTTGLDPEQRRDLEAASEHIPMLISPNMSRAVNLLMKLVGEAAQVLGRFADIDIIERHHRSKKDAPSGTALRLGEVARKGIAAGRPKPPPARTDGVRSPGEVEIHALRVADCPGEHLVIFTLMGETLELGHRALNRDGFARGALDAARFLVGKPPGLYTMQDVLA